MPVPSQWLLAEDTALKAYLSGMTVADRRNNTRPVTVFFRNPPAEERDTVFPYVTIDLVDIEVDHEREHQGHVDWSYMSYVPDGVAPADGFKYTSEWPTPYILTYQVIANSRDPHHDRQLAQQLSGLKFRRSAGMAVEADNTVRRVDLLAHFGRNVDEPVAAGGGEPKRLFQHVYMVGVSSELLPGTVAQVQEALAVVPTIDARMVFDVPLTP
jgi:hypothetical protein